MPKPKEFLFGKKDKIKKTGLQTPEQEQLTKLIIDSLQTGQGPFSDLFKEFDQGAFEEGVSKPALQNFQENILPLLQEKFTGSGYQGTPTAARELGKAGQGLQSTLANLLYQAKTQHGQNAANAKLSLANTALNVRPYENIYKQGSKGIVPGFIEGVGNGLGQAAGGAIAG